LDFSFIFGLASALSYGAGDFATQLAGRAIGVWRATLYYYLLGFAALSAWLLVRPSAWDVIQSAAPWVWATAIASGLALLTAVVLFTQGLINGRIEVVAPVMSGYGAVTTVLSALTGERFTWMGIVGIALIVAGACVIAIPPAGVRTAKAHSGIGWALGAALAYGVGFWMQGAFAVPVLGPFVPIWVVYATGLLVFAVAHRRGMLSLCAPRPRSWPGSAVVAGVCSIIGFLTLTNGLNAGHPAIVVVLSSLASAVTVLIARSVRHTRLELHQWLALASITAGLALVKVPLPQS
jgi:drug/metabolite transporter (DMT)-like permease